MATAQVFEVSVIDGRNYVTTQARGVEYTLMKNGEGWGVATRRLALGSCRGGFKHFNTLPEVAAKCRAFADFYGIQEAA